jgi:hypothetical protein
MDGLPTEWMVYPPDPLEMKHGNRKAPLFILVGGAITILKNTKVNGKDDIPYIMENKKCLKPPTSLFCFHIPFSVMYHDHKDSGSSTHSSFIIIPWSYVAHTDIRTHLPIFTTAETHPTVRRFGS